MSNRYTRPVAFNRNNPVDQLIEKFIGKKNFSGLCKKLIIEKMKEEGIEVPRRKRTPRTAKKEENTKTQARPPQKETAAEKLARMQEELKKRSNNINNNSNSGTDS